MKKLLLVIFTCNIIFSTNLLGQMIVYCILESDGVISDSDAMEYIRYTMSYMIENEDVDIDIKNYAKNYSYTGINKPCNKLIP